MKGWMYILTCADGSYYTGSTNNLELRLAQHQAGEGANHTKKRLPVKLVYYEEFNRIDEAFNREKQLQGWSRSKKEALINRMPENLKKLAACMNETHYRNYNKGGFDLLRLRSAQVAQPPDETKGGFDLLRLRSAQVAQPPDETNGGFDLLRLRSAQVAQPPGEIKGGFDYAQPPDSTTQQPDETKGGFDYAQPPDSTTQQPDETAQPPDETAQPPDGCAQPPDDSAQPPDDASRCLSRRVSGVEPEGRTSTNSISELI